MDKLPTFMRESGIARFLIPLGIILIGFGVVVFVININNKDYIEVESIVIKSELVQDTYTDSDGTHTETSYDVSVKYIVGGKEYESELIGVSKYNVGDKMKIYYNPKDPRQITQSKSMIIPIAIIIGGVAALAGGIVSAINSIKKYKKMKEQEKGWVRGE